MGPRVSCAPDHFFGSDPSRRQALLAGATGECSAARLEYITPLPLSKGSSAREGAKAQTGGPNREPLRLGVDFGSKVWHSGSAVYSWVPSKP